MIYNIEEGQFDLESISKTCNKYGFAVNKHFIWEANDLTENKFAAHISPLSPDRKIDYKDLLLLEVDLEDNEEQDDFFSLNAEVSREEIRISVFS